MNKPVSSVSSSPASRPAASRFRRRLPLALIGLAAVTIAVSGYALVPTDSNDEPKPAVAPVGPAVTVLPVESQVVVEHRELLGHVDAVESVEIRPRVSGHIDEVRLQAGQLVNAGDVLFVIDPRWYQARFDLATAEAQSAQVRVGIAEREAKRANELLEERAVSVEEVDTRTSRLAEARANLLAAQATLDTARLDLEYTRVRSPITGRVSRAYVTAGNLVSGAPGTGTLLTSIVSVGEAYVYADVDEATVLTFKRLQRQGRLATHEGRIPVEMGLGDESGYPHHGYVESLDNRLDPRSGSLVLRMVFPNADGELVPGLFARVKLPVSAPESTLLVSERSIGTDQSQKFVLTVSQENTVEYKTVTLGPVIDGRRVVRTGLTAGDRVIINGLQRVRPGMTVIAENAPQPKAAATLALK